MKVYKNKSTLGKILGKTKNTLLAMEKRGEILKIPCQHKMGEDSFVYCSRDELLAFVEGLKETENIIIGE